MDFKIIDWIVIVGYIILIFKMAVDAAKSVSHSSETSPISIGEEKYLAGKSLTFTESICSIIATEVSALTFLGIPAFAFKSNFSFIQIYFGAIIGRFIIAAVFLPRIYDKGLTIYEIIAKVSGAKTGSGQRTIAIFYAIAKILSVGVRLFSGSILIAEFFGINIYLGLGLVTLMTFFYTLIGGLKAVVRTDIFQMFVFIAGGIIAHYLIPEVSGKSWIELMTLASSSGKTSFFDFQNPLPFFLGILGGILFDMATHGVDQDFAQRLIANKSIKSAQRAIFLSSFISISVGLLFLGIGALLWAHYQSTMFPSAVETPDHLFAYFIVNHFPSGIKGIMVAGVLAATMSTLDSTINAISATVYNDIFPKFKNIENGTHTFLNNFLVTILLFSVAVVATKSDGLLLLGIKIQSWTAGCLLGVFLSKLIFPKFFPFDFNMSSVLGAYIFGTFGVYLNTYVLKWDWNLNVYWGCALSMLFLKIYGLVTKREDLNSSL